MGIKLLDLGSDNNISIQTRSRKIKVVVIGDNNRIIAKTNISRGHKVTVEIIGSNNVISIGNHTSFTGQSHLYMSCNDSKIIIGANCRINSTSFTVVESDGTLYVGDDCLFAWGVDIRCGDGHAIFDKTSHKVLNKAQFIEIGHHVWLAANVQILKNVKVGSDSVVGSRAVVTKDVPPNSIAVGIPARVVRSSVYWKR